jgi:Tfp pilus assembly protein PilO
MDRNRLFVIGAALTMVFVIFFGWTVGVQPQLAASAAAAAETKTVQASNAAQADVLSVLKKDYANIGTLKAQRDQLRKAVPAGTDMSAFIDELHAVVVAHGVTLGNFAVTEGQEYVAPKAAGTDAAAPAGRAAPAPTAGTAPEGLVLMPIQLSVTGQYGKVLDFVQGLQTGTRLVLVTTLTTARSSTNAGAGQDVVAQIGGFAYVLSDRQAEGPVA